MFPNNNHVLFVLVVVFVLLFCFVAGGGGGNGSGLWGSQGNLQRSFDFLFIFLIMFVVCCCCPKTSSAKRPKTDEPLLTSFLFPVQNEEGHRSRH